jgi:hypothetical protein
VNKIESYVWLFFKQICFKIPLNLLIFVSVWQVLPVKFSLSEKVLSEPKNLIRQNNTHKSELQPFEAHFYPIFKSESVIPKLDLSTTGRPRKQKSINSSPLIKQESLDFSATGKPGQRTAGGSRSNCTGDRFNLIALLPKSHWGKTVNERPTFWLYISSLPKSEIVGELVLQDESRNDIDRLPVRLSQNSQLVGLKLPETSTPLTVDRWYRWYFKIYCSSSPIFVQGWIKRVVLDTTTESKIRKTNRQDMIYAQEGIWYDAVNHLAQLVLSYPESSIIRQDWQKLLTSRGVDLRLPK